MKRRVFLKNAAGSAAVLFAGHRLGAQLIEDPDANLRFASEHIKLQLSPVAPAFVSLSVDGLGQNQHGENFVEETDAGAGFRTTASSAGGARRVEYRRSNAPADVPPVWSFELSGSRIVLTSEWSQGAVPPPIVFRFPLKQVHSTVLGVFRSEDILAAPVLIHIPGQGSIRVTSSVPGSGVGYTASKRDMVATLSLPGASADQKRIAYTLDVTAIYPSVHGIENDSRFDAFRRDWLNTLQLNPFYSALSNNTVSYTCAFCYYEYADIAALTPPLAEGFAALDMVRQSLDRILAGGTAYGLPAPGNFPTPSSDTFPSLIIAAAQCMATKGSDAWLATNYEGIRAWAEGMLSTDTNGDGLVKYSISGNSGIWMDGTPNRRPANWWDTIGFGYEDAYGNALAYRALPEMAKLADRLGKTADAKRYRKAALKLRHAFYSRFFDPATGVLGGWRSADGQLHDYYFLWVSGIAIHYGLVSKPQAISIMNKLMQKMREVGYDKFTMGLPGNLVPVALKDYVHRRPDGRFGGGVRPDNSDGFQNYENGGATGCFAYFTVAALYDLGFKEEADKILFAMLEGYGRNGFEGRGKSGMSYDWRRWDGTPMGGEGYLVDNYYTLLAVPLRQSETEWKSGFRCSSLSGSTPIAS